MEILKLSYPQTQNKYNLKAAIGYFDGVHIAHQKLLQKAQENSDKTIAAVITFEPDPWLLFNPGGVYHYLSSPKDKHDLFAANGILLCLELTFNKELANLSPKAFIKYLSDINVYHLVCGYNFYFGQNCSGNPLYLQKKAVFPVTIIEKQDNISSTAIIKLLEEGDIKLANKYLGRSYSLQGTVVKGLGNGRKLGFPTANINPDFSYVLPKDGVYLGEISVDNQNYNCLINSGNNPTFAAKDHSLEVYIADFSQDIYGKTVRVAFTDYLRAEKKFASIEKLIAQLKEDCLNLPQKGN